MAGRSLKRTKPSADMRGTGTSLSVLFIGRFR